MPFHTGGGGVGGLGRRLGGLAGGIGQGIGGIRSLFGGGGPRGPKKRFEEKRGRGAPRGDPRSFGMTPRSFPEFARSEVAVVRRPAPRALTARPDATSAAEKEDGRKSKFPDFGFANGLPFGGGECPPGTVSDSRGFCVSPISPLGAATMGGEAIMGQYGAALVPGSMIVDRAVCLRGMQLGNDGLCYNKSQISNKQRMWPAGRKPLLTGGDMRAISTAARAGRRLDGATKRLRSMGMMKALPAPRKKATGRALVVKEAGAGSVTVQ